MEPTRSLPYLQQPVLVPILCKINLVNAIPSYSNGTYFNIILPFTPRSSNWTQPFRFRYQNRVCIYLLPIRAKYSPILLSVFSFQPNNVRPGVTNTLFTSKL